MGRPELGITAIIVGIVALSRLPDLIQQWPSIKSWINGNPGAAVSAIAALLSASAAVVIAWSSIRTWKVSRDQADIARRQNEIIQEEHKLNADPDLQLYWDSIAKIGDDVQVRFLIVNPGFVPVSVAQSRVYLDGEVNQESQSGFHRVDGGRDIDTPFILSPGD